MCVHQPQYSLLPPFFLTTSLLKVSPAADCALLECVILMNCIYIYRYTMHFCLSRAVVTCCCICACSPEPVCVVIAISRSVFFIIPRDPAIPCIPLGYRHRRALYTYAQPEFVGDDPHNLLFYLMFSNTISKIRPAEFANNRVCLECALRCYS